MNYSILVGLSVGRIIKEWNEMIRLLLIEFDGILEIY
jgi:hypothetical protein